MVILSIIVCTYNRKNLLAECIVEISKQVNEIGRSRAEVIIVDNNCTDGTEKEIHTLSQQYPLSLIKETKQGLSHARNSGALASKGTYLCYLDDDARPSPHYLKDVLQVIQDHSPDIFSGPIFPFYTSQKPFWFQDILEIRCHAQSSGFADCLISGGNYIIRADLLQGLGMFSSEHGMIGKTLRLGEDRELLERYKRLIPSEKRRIYYSLECFVYHYVPPYKMTLRYFVRRAYEGGKMSVLVEEETLAHIPSLAHKATKRILSRLGRRLLKREEDVYIILLIIRRLAKTAGQIVQHVKNFIDKGQEPHSPN